MQPHSRTPSEADPPRIQALAKLPVFLELRGRRAVVAGGTVAAAWKAELLVAAGAAVDVFASAPCDEMLALDVAVNPRTWRAEDVAGAAIAIADCGDDDEAKRFRDAARAAGALCSVIDRPKFCDAQFGSIVNRSPVVVSISTDGAAPVLGQAIRRRIEALLPAQLSGWAALAKSIRREVAARFPDKAARAAFWTRFADRAFTEKVPTTTGIVTQAARPARGSVTLVGAGPGDADLLTIKALRALQNADAILFDDLVSDEVLDLARREAKRFMVGKRGGRESCRQDDINALMIKLARAGRRVVRLKSGDPMIFGRAGEEIAQLEAAGIAVEVVPGITAALAAASSLGVSLTHRDHAHSVRFVTGHARSGALPEDLDWRGLADPQTSLVFYMAGRTSREVAARLALHGLPAATPVVAIAGVSRPNEAKWSGTLDRMAAADLPLDPGLPILVGIGAVFARAAEAVPERLRTAG